MTAERHRRLTELFGDLCDLPTDEQARAVAGLRGQDAGLAAELEDLLRADREDIGVLATARVAAGAAALAEELLGSDETRYAGGVGAAIDAPVPARVGDYRVLRRVGEGGMGEVYEAEQDNPRRRVALKMIRPELASARVRRRFAFETQVLARLDHPGIARIYEAGTHEGRFFFAMELIEGETLTRYAERAGLDARARLALLARVCDAVHHAHIKGVLHRDLKPGNILVQPDGQPKVLDFGIARLTDHEHVEHTRTGEIVGTPAYMSPEQTARESSELDSRSDVYTLGVVGYELLVGRLPYPLRGVPFAEVIRMVQQDEPVPLGQVRRALRGDVETIFAKALAKEPERRYSSAAALADDLRRFLASEPIAARPPAVLYQLGKFARRSPTLAAALAWVLLSVVGGAAVVYWLYVQGDAARARAEAQRAAAERANDALTQRNHALVLLQAGASLGFDPTLTVAWLKTLPAAGGRWDAVFAAAHEARGRGVAIDILRGHRDEVRWVEFSPDGKLIATASYDHTLRLWDGAARTVRVLRGHTDEAHFALFSPDGAALLSGSLDRTLRLWRLDGTARAVDGPGGAVEVAAWAVDGSRFAAGGADGGIGVYDGRGERLRLLAGHRGVVGTLAWSERGALASGGLDGEVRVWDPATGGAQVLRGHTGEVTQVAFLPGGARLASAGRDGDLRLWDLASGAARVLGGHRHELRTLSVSADGRRLATGDRAGAIRVWDVAAGTSVALAGHPDVVRQVLFSPDGAVLASASDDRTVRLWHADGGQVQVLLGHEARVRQLAFSRDGARLASAASDGTVRVWPGRPPERTALVGHQGAVVDALFAPSGRAVATAGVDGTVRLWHLDSLRTEVLAGHTDELYDLAFTADGNTLLSAGRDKVARVWDLTTGAVLVLPAAQRVVRIDVAPDGRWAAAAQSGSEVPLWDLRSGERRMLSGHVERVNDVRFAPDGARFASAGEDGTVRVWDAATGAGTIALRFGAEVGQVTYAPDGSYLAAAGDDGTIRTWDSRAGERILRGHDGPVTALAIAPDGSALASGGADRTVRVWDLRSATSRTLHTHAGKVTAVGFARAGAVVFSAGEDRALKLSDRAGAATQSLSATAPIRVLSLSPDGTRLVAAGDEDLVRIWPSAVPDTAAEVLPLLDQMTHAVVGPEDLLTAPYR